MKHGLRSFAFLALLSPAVACTQDFLPAKSDAATGATIKLFDGTADRDSTPLDVHP